MFEHAYLLGKILKVESVVTSPRRTFPLVGHSCLKYLKKLSDTIAEPENQDDDEILVDYQKFYTIPLKSPQGYQHRYCSTHHFVMLEMCLEMSSCLHERKMNRKYQIPDWFFLIQDLLVTLNH
jgi:hypothetical protein